ncbi:MAG: hypothetical protein J3K34DRAFT_431435 [Monoraphidium minutum]|nr:MAG: hypothetical protein J3K34DRAFT_431435 [Monoraphidium minutum]
MADRGAATKAVEKAVRASGKSKEEVCLTAALPRLAARHPAPPRAPSLLSLVPRPPLRACPAPCRDRRSAPLGRPRSPARRAVHAHSLKTAPRFKCVRGLARHPLAHASGTYPFPPPSHTHTRTRTRARMGANPHGTHATTPTNRREPPRLPPPAAPPPSPKERNDVVGLVLSCLLTAAGAGLTGFFGDQVRKNRVAAKK